MTFLSPAALWLLLAVPLLAAGYVWLQRRRKRYVVRFTNLELLAAVAPRRPDWRRHVAPVLMLATLALLVGALARPVMTVRVPKEQSSVILVVDVSRSMLADDLSPSRMEAAKQAAADFVRSVPRELRLGVVAFSNTASLIAPLTDDREIALRAIGSLTPIAGTAVGEGLYVALDEIRRERTGDKEVPAAVLLLSDGETNLGRPSAEAAAEAATMEVPVFTVGVGTPDAILEFQGQRIPVSVDEDELRAIAETTGGAFFKTADAGTLRAVYQKLGSELGYEREQREVAYAAAGLAALLLLGAGISSAVWFQRIP